MSNIIIGLTLLISSLIYLVNLLRRRKDNEDIWSNSMRYKGLVGGITFIIIGIIMVVKGFSNL